MDSIFRHEAIIVIIVGFWKHGKTNVGLKIAEDLIKFGLIEVCATNIKITETKTMRYIEDMETLKEFHYDDPDNPIHKAFIFDEAGKLAVKRGAMRRENVSWMKFIPELSKGRMKLIVITQAEFLTDSMFTETEFTRATINAKKHERYGYSITVESELIDPNFIIINKFPKCKTEYSAYSSAEWFLTKREQTKSRQLYCCKIARLYAVEKWSSTKIANEEGLKTRLQVMNILKRHIRHTLNQLTMEDKEIIAKEYALFTQQDVPVIRL